MMNIPHLLLALLLLAAPCALRGDGDDDSPLHAAMETMGKTFRGLNRGLQAPDPALKTEYLASLQTIQAAAVEAKQHTPASIAKLPEAEQPARLAAFRTDLAAAIETMLQLERAILADDWSAAQDLVKKLGALRKEGHDKHDPKDEAKP